MQRPDIKALRETLVRRYCEGASFRMLAEDYHCHWQTARHHVMKLMSPEFAAVLSAEHHHMEGLDVKQKFQPGHHTKSEYRPGQIRGAAARRYTPLGTIRLRTRKNCHGKPFPLLYVIKVDDEPYGGPANWKPLAVYRWEQAHGHLKPGWAVIHKDGNNLNDSLENLLAIPPSQMMAHSRQRKPHRFTTRVRSRAAKRQWVERHKVMQAIKNLKHRAG